MAPPSGTSFENREPAALEERDIQKLVLDLRSGNRGAATRLYWLHVRAVYRAVRAQCATDSEAEDIVQETFLKAFHAIDRYRYREGIRFLAWLLKIASTTTYKSARKRRRLEVLPPSSLLALQEVDSAAHYQSVPSADSEERRSALDRLLKTLPERERAVLTMRYAADLTAAEVGHALGLSEPNVRKICERARAKVLDHLKEDMPASENDPRPRSETRSVS